METKSSLLPVKEPIRILSIDGGGILGLIPLILMQRLGTARAGFLDKVDLFAGTSTGGIIALGLARGLHVGALREFYEKEGPRIFTRSFLHRWALTGPRYVNTYLEEILKTMLIEETRMKDLKKRVLIPSFDLDNEEPLMDDRHWKPKFFSNYPNDNDLDVPAWKVALCTSAAPTYFPTYRGYIDGGVIANNPAMCAVAKVLHENPELSVNDVRVLSFATYDTNQYISGDKSFGLFGVKTLVDILLNGSERVVDYQCKELLDGRYFRVRSKQQPGVKLELDDVKKIPIMINIAEMTDLRDVGEWLDNNW